MAENEANSGDQSWRTNLLRQNVRNKIEEAIRMSGNPTSKTVAEMENHIYIKARTKEEYLSFVARLILHVKEMNSKKQSGMQQIVGQSSAIIGGQVSQQSSDPMSALQNMAGPQPINDISNGNAMHLSAGNVGNEQILVNNPSSGMIGNMSHIGTNINPNATQMNRIQNPMAMTGNRMMNQMMMSQNQTRPQVLSPSLQVQLQRIRQPNPNMVNINQISGPAPVQESKYFDGQQIQNNSAVNQNQQFKTQQMTGQPMGSQQMGGQPMGGQPMSGQPMGGQQMGGQPMGGQPMGGQQMGGQQMGGQQMGGQQMGGQQMGGQQMGGQPMTGQQMVGQQMNGQPMVGQQMGGQLMSGQHMGGQQFQNQNQVMNGMQSINQLNPPTPQMMPSPSGYAPSSSPMMPSPHTNLIRPTGSMGAPSPQSISLNTPANIMIASPGSVGPGGRPTSEEQLYLEKLRNLQKYVDPLRKMIARIDQDDRYSNDKKKELDKMKNLLSILTDPSRRCPMTTLEKCEQFLEKMDFKIKTETTVAPIVNQMTTHPTPKIQDVCQPLLDAITAHIKKPLFNHTLQRTFGPAVAALTNNAYKHSSSPTLKRKYEDECEVPEVLQGEIARLDARFKVQLDPLQHFGSKTIHLICKLDDKDLPCVPPIAIRVPESYPEKPPQCSTDALEYSASIFFQDIQKKFDVNIDKLPEYFSVTSLLNSWELSVRQAVSSALEPIYT